MALSAQLSTGVRRQCYAPPRPGWIGLRIESALNILVHFEIPIEFRIPCFRFFRCLRFVHNLISFSWFWPSLASYPQKPFLAFTDVLEKIRPEVTQKVWISLKKPRITQMARMSIRSERSRRFAAHPSELPVHVAASRAVLFSLHRI